VHHQPLGFEQQLPTVYRENSECFLPISKIWFVVNFDGRDSCGNRSVEEFLGSGSHAGRYEIRTKTTVTSSPNGAQRWRPVPVKRFTNGSEHDCETAADRAEVGLSVCFSHWESWKPSTKEVELKRLCVQTGV